MMKQVYFSIFFVLLLSASYDVSAQKGRLTVNNDMYLDSAIHKNITRNKLNRNMNGYRIQLFSGAERNNAHALKTKFLKLFPETPAYLVYQQPYFKLRVGDFRNKLEAQQLYYKLQDEFGQVIIVPDKINLPRL